MSFLRKRLRPRLWIAYLFAIALLVASRPTPVSLVVGGLIVVAGEALRLWATGHLHKNDALTVTGPYAFLRNPLYLGTLLVAGGLVVMGGTVATLALFLAFVAFFFGYYMPYKNRIEGARLERLYGDAFRRYAVAVPSLLPRLHAYRPLEGDRPRATAWRGERFADNDELGTALGVGLAILAMVARWALV